MPLSVEKLGRMPYAEAHRLQRDRVAARLRGEIPDTLLLLEHPAVITLGRGTDPANVLAPGDVPVIPVERGGDVTLHAPGQIVGYVVRLLPEDGRDLHAHLRLLEEIQRRALDTFGLQGRTVAGKAGIWVGERKIGSIGTACTRWCTWHGFALNVSTDLALFDSISPCGFPASVMTTMARELGRDPGLDAVNDALARAATDLLDER